jgi:cold shock protein
MMAGGNNGSAQRRPGGPRFRVAALPFLLSRVTYWSAHKFTGAINAKGAVRWFNPTEGHGYTQPQGGGKDMFVHISVVEQAGLATLNDGQVAEYEELSDRGEDVGRLSENLPSNCTLFIFVWRSRSGARKRPKRE